MIFLIDGLAPAGFCLDGDGQLVEISKEQEAISIIRSLKKQDMSL